MTENYKYIVWLKDRYDKEKSYRIRKAKNNHFYLQERKIDKETNRILYDSHEVLVSKKYITAFIEEKIFNYSFDGTDTILRMEKFNKVQNDMKFKRMKRKEI